MMLLRNTNGDYLEIEILGYEQPQGEFDWVVVEGRVRRGELEWRFRHPSLEAGDLVALSGWFEALAESKSEELAHGIHFTEPNLSFEFIDPQAGLTPILVLLSAEARPPGDQTVPSTVTMRFAPTVAELAAAAEALRAYAARFPAREPGAGGGALAPKPHG